MLHPQKRGYILPYITLTSVISKMLSEGGDNDIKGRRIVRIKGVDITNK